MKALLVVDVQNGLVEKALFEKDRFLRVVKNAVYEFRRKKYTIIGIQHSNNQLIENTKPWMIVDYIGINAKDQIIQKTHGNAFIETKLHELLQKDDIKEITICGLVSHGCVRATCLGGIDEGYKVSLLKNGHSCWNKDAKEKIKIMEEELTAKGISIKEIEEIVKEEA